MKYIFSLFFLLLLSISSYAQPANDDCAGLIDLGIAPICDSTAYTNLDATPTDIGANNQPDCFVSFPPSNDVWFQFQTAADVIDYTVTISGITDGPNADALNNIQFAIYRGFCGEGSLFFNNCAVGNLNEGVVSLDLENLTPSEIYFIRVDNFGDEVDEGDFIVCIEEKVDNTIDDGFSSACTGTLFDTGGPDGNYGDNENNVFTICPSQITNCLTLDFVYYNLEEGGDNITIYNGPDTDSPVITDFDSFDGQQSGGGVCLRVQADSCMTIQFESDAGVNFEGFEANWFCSSTACEVNTPLNVEIGAMAETIENAISTPTAQVTVDTIICDDGAYGTFSMGEDTDLGLERGLILTSGSPNNAIGPNNSTSSGDIVGDFDDGDEDLDVLSDLFGDFSTSNDACVVEVDVTVFSETIEFEYIFGSEEYPEFVNTGFNDIFALLISGPGIDGIPEINNQDNMAIIPGTNTPIQINSVNNDENWEYYRDNNNGLSLEYDGLTSGFLGNKKSLTASATVMPCSTYHLKFAVADRGDSSFDSGVFISEIRSGVPEIATSFSSGLDYFVENCLSSSNDTVIIVLDEALSIATDYDVTISGTATNPDDYIMDIPSTITFGIGVTELKFPIEVFTDDITEGEETVIISLFRDFGCGSILINELVIPIRENILVEIETESDSLIACSDNNVQLSANGATSYVWEPFNAFDNPFVSDPVLDAGFSGWVFVEGKIDPFTSPECIGRDSIFINLVEPEVTIETDDTEICEGDTVILIANNNVNDSNLTWVVTNSFFQVEEPTNDTTAYAPPFGFVGSQFEIVATVDLSGCIATDTVVISVDPYDLLTPIFEDTLVCQGAELQLFENEFFVNINFDIDPTTDVVDPEDPFTTVFANNDIEYEVITSSPSNFCADTFNFEIDVVPNFIEIAQGDSVRICLGDDLDLTTIIDPLDGLVIWEEEDSLTVLGNDANVNPTETTTYFVGVDNGVCQAIDSIIVYVDSLPFMPISTIPIRDPYCMGEPLTFTSPGYFIGDFPLIEHMWDVTTGFEPDSENNYNVGLTSVDTTLYIRTTTNGACTVMDSILINVIDPMIELNIPDTTICEGESVDFNISSDNEIDNIVWDSGSGEFTCDDCEMTTLNNITQTTTVSVQADVEGCPTSTSGQVAVVTYSGNILADPELDCNFFGDVVTLTANFSPELPAGTLIEWFQDGVILPEFTNQDSIVVTLPGDDGMRPTQTIEFTWRVTDAMGCQGEITKAICAERRFDIPDAFSPGNNDGVNDLFRIVDKGAGTESSVEILAFKVYNRWGQKMFDCATFECATQSGWDGSLNNVDQPGGTYMYYVEMRYPDGNMLKFEGDLLLIK